ncbi:MAG TPA: phosphopantetheine-binding protein [Sphingomicrobium sp.]|nr:phosphopantetheine-binding protein [Sphingomicrobium sp.]
MLHKAEKAPDEVIAEVTLRELLSRVLGLAEAQVSGFAESTALFGSLPEFDSMAVASFLTALEERLGILIEDDDVDAEDFASFGSLLAFVDRLQSR